MGEGEDKKRKVFMIRAAVPSPGTGHIGPFLVSFIKEPHGFFLLMV